MADLRQWVEGARPRTLPAAVAPVLLGSAVAQYEGSFLLGRAALALVVALALQVGVNYANDYSDGLRGTDELRAGPVRLVGQRLASPAAVRTAALASFLVAALAGLALVTMSGAWWLLLVGAAAIVAAWTYTGGPRPYGYAGLGEVFVFVFFGIVATAGTAYVQTGTITPRSLGLAAGVGLLNVAILVTNNLRDIPGDTLHGKRTLAVRLGDPRTRTFYLLLVVLAYVAVVAVAATAGPWGAALGLVSAPLAVPALRTVRAGAVGRELVPVLAATGRLVLAYAVLTSVGLLLS